MLYNDDDKKKKKKPGFNTQAFKHAIGMIESSGGKNMWNKNTSATGKYQFLYNLIKNDPDMKGVTRRAFMRDSDLQDKIMDKALNGKLKGFVYGTGYADKIKKRYNSDYSTEDITALLHFLGPGDSRKFLKNPEVFKVKGVNKTPQDYISKFRGMYDEHPSQIKAVEEFNRNLELENNPPKMPAPIDASMQGAPNQGFTGMPNEYQGNQMNSFRFGGSMSCGGPGQPPCDEKHFEVIRNSRQGLVNKNDDDTVSTHRMTHQSNPNEDGTFISFPTLFLNEDKSWEDLNPKKYIEEDDYKGERGWGQAYDRAVKDNEIYTFKTEEEARKFAVDGSWKKSTGENNSFKYGGNLGPGDPPLEGYENATQLPEITLNSKKKEKSWVDSALDVANEYVYEPMRDAAFDAADVGMAVAGNIANMPHLASGGEDLPTQYRLNRNPDGSLNMNDMVSKDNREMWERNKDVSGKAVELAAGEVAGLGIGHGIGHVAKKLKRPAEELLENISKIETSIHPSQYENLHVNGIFSLTDFLSKKNKFKSDMDWSKWNKEIPNNKALMKEYLDIEKKSKANGTWMKNSDGSRFDGSPETFIQVNSKNFKKAYPEGYEKVFRGMIKENPYLLEKEDYTGVFSGDKNLAKGYGDKLYELAMKKSDNSFMFNGVKDDWLDLRFAERNIESLKKNLKMNEEHLKKIKEGPSKEAALRNINSIKKAILENTEAEKNPLFIKMRNHFKGKEMVATDDVASYLEKEGLDNIQIKNILDGDFGDINISNQVPGNYLKSLIGNNGMFDMSNPNIHKTVAASLGTGALVKSLGASAEPQKENSFKYGGQMKDSGGANDLVTIFEGGGSHEQNPLGGIPIGVGSNGKQNLVEEGETKWNDYVFSNSIGLDGIIGGDDINTNSYKEGGYLNSPVDPPANGKVKKEFEDGPPVNPELGRKYSVQDVPGFVQYENKSITHPDIQNKQIQDSYPQIDMNYKTRPVDNKTTYKPTGKRERTIQDYSSNWSDDNSKKAYFEKLAGDNISKKKFLEWYSNPETARRLMSNGKYTQLDIDNRISKALNTTMDGNMGDGWEKDNAKAFYDNEANSIHMTDMNDYATGFHELTHASGFDMKVGDELGYQTYDGSKFEDTGNSVRFVPEGEDGNLVAEKYGVLGNPYKQEGKNDLDIYKQYYKEPSEKYGNLNELRMRLGLKPGQKITVEELKKLVKEKGLENENFYRVFEDKNIVNSMNTVAFQGQGNNNDYDNYRSNRMMNA